nr:branched-chain amino acid ABC transporter ATP-binding protein/permease [Variovorax sp. JS1663]
MPPVPTSAGRRIGLVLGCLVAIAPLAPIPEYWITLLNYIGLNALVALGIVLLTGIAGMTSFGQAAFVGVGAYAGALVSSHFAAWPWLGLAAALAVVVPMAMALGLLTMKLSGHYLPIGTLAWGVALYYFFGNQEALGKFDGLSGIPPVTVFGWPLTTGREMYVLILSFLAGAMLAVRNLLDSRVGRAIHSLRAAPLVAESCGASVPLLRMRVFVIAALLAGIAGWLYAHTQRAVNPTPFNLSAGITYLFMAVIGGAAHIWGAVIGAAAVTVAGELLKDALPRLLGSAGNYEGVALGVATILLLQRAPDGIWPALVGKLGPREQPVQGDGDAATLCRPASVRKRPLPARGTPLLEVHAVRKRYGGLVAIDGIDLTMRAGEIVGLIGPNGAGKSTLFNAVSGVLATDGGTIAFMGADLTGRQPREFARSGMGRTFQHVQLLPEMTCLDNVAMGAYLHGAKGWIASMLRLDRAEERDLRAQALAQLNRVGLGAYAERRAGSLALGQQRILEIARALAAQPVLLLLDEPAAGLRHGEKRALAMLLRALRAEGVAVLIVEHDMDFLMALADRLVVTQFGKVIAEGSPEAIRCDPVVQTAYMGDADD